MEKSKRQSVAKIGSLKVKLQFKRAENRELRQRLKLMEKSRDYQRTKVRRLRKESKGLAKQRSRVMNWTEDSKTIAGHKYDSGVVSLCIALYAFAGCSFRGIRRVLLCLQLELGISPLDLPCKSSISNWVEKTGYYHYQRDKSEDWSEYCLILDESMVVGKERMLVVLGAPAQKEGEEALKLKDVQVLGFAVNTSWKWPDVQDFLEKVQEKMGKKASYVVCDGAGNLTKGVWESELVRIFDTGHEICKLTDQTYRDDNGFKEWIKAVTKVRFQVFMKDTAYLLPPKQRTVARFTNLSPVIKWAINMLKTMPKFSVEEQQTYGWLKTHDKVIQELEQVFKMNESILKILKNQGISTQNIEKSIEICHQYDSTVPSKLIDKIVNYLKGEKEKLPDENKTWQVSSDILESLFGKYKYRAPANALNGVTGRILSLCLFTSGNGNPGQLNEHVVQALESVSIPTLTKWKSGHLIDNQIIKRRKMFKN